MNRYLVVSACLAMVSTAQADFVTPVGFGWSRGAVNSTYGQWEVFTAAAGPNAPDVGQFNPTGRAFDAFDSSGGSFITASGNIYSFSLPTNIHVIAPSYELGAAYTTTIILQVRTVGSEILASSVNVGGIAPVETTELFRQDLGAGGPGGGGFLVETLYRFVVTGNAASYEIRFDGAASSMSLDRIAVDTHSVGACYVNCDASTAAPVLSANDFQCFLNKFAAGESYANCDNSTVAPILNANDFQCFLNAFAAGCP